MNDYASLKNRRTYGGGMLLMLLLLMCVCSFMLLFGRILSFSASETSFISLLHGAEMPSYPSFIETRAEMVVSSEPRPITAALETPEMFVRREGDSVRDTSVSSSGGSPSLYTVDADSVTWETYTSVDMFLDSYVNPGGDVTVDSADGAKVLAPGTSNSYVFYIKNTGSAALDYKVKVEDYFLMPALSIPLEVRMQKNADWVCGDASSWELPEDLNGYVDTGKLAPGKTLTYTFYWQWPFESYGAGGVSLDSYDTGLGNISVGTDVDFVLNILTEAQVSTSAPPISGWHWPPSPMDPPEEGGGMGGDGTGGGAGSGGAGESGNTVDIVDIIPKTGDASHIGLWAGVMGVSLALFLLLMLYRRRDEDKEAEAAEPGGRGSHEKQ